MQIDLLNKKILLIGGTGTLGAQFTKQFSSMGARVIYTYFSDEELAGKLCAKNAEPLFLDLHKREQTKQLKELIKKRWGELDALVFNAGFVRDRTVTKMSEDEFDSVIDGNLSAAQRIVKALLPLLYRAQKAKLVFITSRVGQQGGFGEANYAAAKAGLAAYVKTLAVEVGRKGICVNAISPGFMLSKMTKNLPEEVYVRQKQISALGQLGDPEEVAQFVSFLLSEKVQNLSGQVINFDSRRTKLF